MRVPEEVIDTSNQVVVEADVAEEAEVVAETPEADVAAEVDL